MFAKTIIDSDAFLDMPLSTQSLYFHLSMRADDDGFINNPKKIQRMVGSSEDDLKLLIAKRFILVFESGVIVIKHWKIHNYIQKDRYKPTVYQDEKEQLALKSNSTYTLDTLCIHDGYRSETQDRLGKDRLGKDRDNSRAEEVEKIPYTKIINYLNEKANKNFKVIQKHKDFIKARWNEGQRLDDFKQVIDNMVANWSGQNFKGKPAETYLQPSTLFGNKFDQYLNQTPKKMNSLPSDYDDLGF